MKYRGFEEWLWYARICIAIVIKIWLEYYCITGFIWDLLSAQRLALENLKVDTPCFLGGGSF